MKADIAAFQSSPFLLGAELAKWKDFDCRQFNNINKFETLLADNKFSDGNIRNADASGLSSPDQVPLACPTKGKPSKRGLCGALQAGMLLRTQQSILFVLFGLTRGDADTADSKSVVQENVSASAEAAVHASVTACWTDGRMNWQDKNKGQPDL